ncbi:uncharacterized protein DUF2628 [Breoghania corrubedonensis]|uniref:Uncharacterized protein DUF2628 n=1 Tax=Breoghania corrubedonensis TaxID=665038 RepID=A0A2T5VHI9_9HYPH|nr:DUF2628 domain-containing protein [Breoghania corrubedonensis]PTW63213.1 uncharacterized protein DUF2628 [Breoghania corrubedonensis]
MTVYMAMTPLPSGNAEQDANRVVFIKEGFCWPAFFFAVPWLVYRGMWLALVGYLVLAIVVTGAGDIIGGVAPFVVGLAFSVLFALEANEMRRWSLERRGYNLAGVTSGANHDECETRFFSAWKGPEQVNPPLSARHSGSARDAAPNPLTREPTPSDEVIGLFPEASR